MKELETTQPLPAPHVCGSFTHILAELRALKRAQPQGGAGGVLGLSCVKLLLTPGTEDSHCWPQVSEIVLQVESNMLAALILPS